MSDCPEELRYTKSHEWVRVESNQVITVGITDHAQSLLGDIVFVELPDVNREVVSGEEIAVVESVKTAADVYTPVTGEIIAVNDELDEAPGQVNQDPYGTGWLYQLKLTNEEEMESLLDAQTYQETIEE